MPSARLGKVTWGWSVPAKIKLQVWGIMVDKIDVVLIETQTWKLSNLSKPSLFHHA